MSADVLSYKGRRLVRCGDDMFYGNVSEPRVVFMHVDSRSDDKFRIPTKVSVGLVGTLAAAHGVVFKPFKFGIRDSLFEALDLACAWLDRQGLPKK